MTKRAIFFAFALLAVSFGLPAGAVTYYVDVLNGNDAYAGTNWPTAKFSIQAGVGSAVDGETVLVADGVYVLTSGVVVSRGILIQSMNGASNTVVDGRYPYATNQCFNVDHSNAVVDGFTIVGGRSLMGGGVYLSNGSTLQNCIVESNSATFAGGGVYANTHGIVRRCSVLNNVAENTSDGGGIYSFLDGLVEGCVVYGNSARIGGGVVSMFHGQVVNCVIAGNTASQGGGLHCSQYSTIQNCTISGNSAQTGGGADAFFGGTFRNTIIYNNTASRGSNYFQQVSADQAAVFDYSCTAPLPAGVGNISVNPLFVDAAGENYRLQAGSPCLDSGSDLGAPTNDLIGVFRPLDGDGSGSAVTDMGAYERQP
jgi:putative surface-exposed virulence protein